MSVDKAPAGRRIRSRLDERLGEAGHAGMLGAEPHGLVEDGFDLADQGRMGGVDATIWVLAAA
jgi:hypothetical protein